MARLVTKTAPKAAAKNRQFSEYRQILLEKAEELSRQMSTPVAAEIVSRAEEPKDMVDLAGQSHEQWLFLNRNAQNASVLRQVEEALERIGAGAYGICDDCGQQISLKRLAAVPWAKYCIVCQEKRGPWTN